MVLSKLDIKERSDVADGKSFGDFGPYEYVRGLAHFEADPLSPFNQVVTDIALAPLNHGKVLFSADFALLQPRQKRRNVRLIIDVPNRGRPTILRLDTAPGPPGPASGEEPWVGDGWLLKHGYALGWCGWQHDIPQGSALGLSIPDAIEGERPVRGRMMCAFLPSRPTKEFMLSDRGAKPYPAFDLDEGDATLLEFDYPFGPRREIPRKDWRFARLDAGKPAPDPTCIYYEGSFKPGKTYVAIYTCASAPVTGLGFLALRDFGSYLRFSSATPMASPPSRCMAFGISQSGRVLRHMLYLGLCDDEQGRQVFDGLLPHIAGGRRTEVNWRFGQSSYTGPFSVINLFPFSDAVQREPRTGRKDGLQMRVSDRGRVPKVIYTNSSVEYWESLAAMTHVTLDGKDDLELPQNVRIYHFSGTQHGPAPLPLSRKTAGGDAAAFHLNTVDYYPLLRAALVNLDRWVCGESEPPPNRHPSFGNRTLVDRESLRAFFARFPPGMPEHPLPVARLYFGDQAAKGLVTQIPPLLEEPYRALVPAVDEDGNEVGGVRHPDVSVPLATYTGWNPRDKSIGGEDQPLHLAGATMRFAPGRAEREAAGDARLSITERYSSKEDFVSKIRGAAETLVKERYMLGEDVEGVVAHSGERYDELLNAEG